MVQNSREIRERNIDSITAGYGTIRDRVLQGRLPVSTVIPLSMGNRFLGFCFSKEHLAENELLHAILGIYENISDPPVSRLRIRYKLLTSGLIEANVSFKTDKSYESNGLATGLALKTDEVVLSTIRRERDQFDGHIVRGVIVDAAQGAGGLFDLHKKERVNWSSDIARRLHFSQIKDNLWYKTYKNARR
jgi:hypothetical protein